MVEKCNTGFTITEAMVAAIIFAIAAAGMFSAASGFKRPMNAADRSLQAASCGQQVLEHLRAHVDARDFWLPTSKLAKATAANPSHSCSEAFTWGQVVKIPPGCGFYLDGCTYTVNEIENGIRNVTLKMTWQDEG